MTINLLDVIFFFLHELKDCLFNKMLFDKNHSSFDQTIDLIESIKKKVLNS